MNIKKYEEKKNIVRFMYCCRIDHILCQLCLDDGNFISWFAFFYVWCEINIDEKWAYFTILASMPVWLAWKMYEFSFRLILCLLVMGFAGGRSFWWNQCFAISTWCHFFHSFLWRKKNGIYLALVPKVNLLVGNK